MKNIAVPTLMSVTLVVGLITMARADKKADVLIQQAAKTTAGLQTLTADVETAIVLRGKRTVQTGRLTFKRPNLSRVEFPGAKGGVQVSDGKNRWAFSTEENNYFKFSAKADGSDIEDLAPFGSFFFTPSIDGLHAYVNSTEVLNPTTRKFEVITFPAKTRYIGKETWRGTQFQVVELTREKPFPYVLKAYIGADRLLHRAVAVAQIGDVTRRDEVALTNIKVNKTVPTVRFAYSPPKNAKPYKSPVSEQKESPLLAAGATAPDFTVQDRDGKPIKLSDFRGKVVVLDFWATWCGPCMRSLPHTNDVAARFKDKGVVVLAVNVWDSKEAFSAWPPKNTQYNAIVFAVDTSSNDKDVAKALYHVNGIPTQYVIDRDGKVVRSFVGYGGPTTDLEEAIKAAGAS